MRRLLSILIPVLALALLAAGCGGDDSSTSTAADTAPADTTAAAETGLPEGCQAAEPAAPKTVDESKPTKKLKAGVDYVVKMTTNCGEIDIQLDTQRQPKTAASFAHLVEDGVYDGLTFHRVIPNFVIQGGDPAGNGSGGPGYKVVEKPPADADYAPGVVAMAKGEVERPGTSGSQFFIMLPGTQPLPPDYALVGTVIGDGMTAVNRIASVPTDAADAPTVPMVIEKATLSEG